MLTGIPAKSDGLGDARDRISSHGDMLGGEQRLERLALRCRLMISLAQSEVPALAGAVGP